jgi:hypothetical protein
MVRWLLQLADMEDNGKIIRYMQWKRDRELSQQVVGQGPKTSVHKLFFSRHMLLSQGKENVRYQIETLDIATVCLVWSINVKWNPCRLMVAVSLNSDGNIKELMAGPLCGRQDWESSERKMKPWGPYCSKFISSGPVRNENRLRVIWIPFHCANYKPIAILPSEDYWPKVAM